MNALKEIEQISASIEKLKNKKGQLEGCIKSLEEDRRKCLKELQGMGVKEEDLDGKIKSMKESIEKNVGSFSSKASDLIKKTQNSMESWDEILDGEEEKENE